MFQIEFVEKIKTHILCSIIPPPNLAIYETMWKNIVQPDRPQMTLQRMRITCWIPKATNTHIQYVILLAFPVPPWLHARASTLHYTYVARLVSVKRGGT